MTLVDSHDPLVVALTWVLTWAVGQTGQRIDPRVRRMLPLVALLLAVGLRSALETLEGRTLDLDTGCHALAAAGVAMLGHSQARELAKLWQADPEATAGPGAPETVQVVRSGSEGDGGSSGASGHGRR